MRATAGARSSCAARGTLANAGRQSHSSPSIPVRNPGITMAAPALHTEFLSIGQGVSGFLAKPSGVPGIGVVVIMEAFGLNAFVKSVCERFARAGYMALAPDVYHGDTFDYADRERAIARLNEVDDDVAMREVGSALDVL